MGVIKVETFDVSPSTDGTTHTLTNDVGDVTSAFVKINSSSDKGSGPVGNTGDAGPRDVYMGVSLTDTDEITFHKGGTAQMRKMGEVWRYTGSAGGRDEFIVRGHLSITLAFGVVTNTTTIPGLSDRNRVVPFLTGLSTTSTSVTDYDATSIAVYVNSSGALVASRQTAGTAVTVYVSVVEFTGSNWTVAHGISSNHDTEEEFVTLNSDSTGTGGSVVDIGNWANAFMEVSMEGDTAETGLTDNLIIVEPGNTTDEVRFFLHIDPAGANNGDAYVHVIHNPGIVMARTFDLAFPETDGTLATVGFPTGASLTESIDEIALEWFADTTGTGTAHARGRIIARITDATGTISYWNHRVGNNVSVYSGLINLSNVSNLAPVTISSAPKPVATRGTNLTITGTNFESVQGTGAVYISDTPVIGTGTDVVQSIDSWSDTSIQFDATLTGLSDGLVYIIVRNDSGSVATWLTSKDIESYTDVITGLSNAPDHYHTFDRTYSDELGGLFANGQDSVEIGRAHV